MPKINLAIEADSATEMKEILSQLATGSVVEVTQSLNTANKKATEEVEENQELHTRAILDGYTVKKEPMYEIPLSCLKTTDGEVQYLSYKDKKWFASRKHTWLKQRFTETELKEKVPEFYRELAKEV